MAEEGEEAQQFPPVQPGGSLILAWQVKDRNVLLVGGGNVAASRLHHLLSADALITLISPLSGCSAETLHRISTFPSRITHVDRTFLPSDLDTTPPPTLVLTAVDDPAASSSIYKLCHEKRIPVNVADVPPECDFYFGSVHRDGPLQIMVSTNGNGPRLASIIRKRIAGALPDNTGAAIEKVGILRRKLREMAGGQEEGGKRMGWMSKVCDTWSLDDLCEMTEKDMDVLLRGFAQGKVASRQDCRALHEVMASVKLGEKEDDEKEQAGKT